MARKPTIDAKAVVKALRNGTVKNSAEAARKFGCSRVRVTQILETHAPDLLSGKARNRTQAQARAIRARQEKSRKATVKALQDHETIVAAARALGLTASGLYNRMRRLGIEA